MIGLYTVSIQVSDMARRRMKSKIQPAVQTLVFTGPEIGNDEDRTMFIDLSQCASLMNRRFYRQGLNWAVSNIRVVARRGDATNEVYCPVTIQKLPNTWIMSNAWEKGFRLWQKMIKEATDDSGMESIKGKFLDFKIYANQDHYTNGFGNNLLPIDSNGNVATPGQWQPSEYVIPDTPGDTATGMEIVAVGPNNTPTYVSLIQGYADSRALPGETEPNVPDDASTNWQQYLFSEGNTQDNMVITDLEFMGDKAPYPYENDGTNLDTMYPGGETNLPGLEIHDESVISSTTVSSTLHLKGGNFPCGLIGVRFNNFGIGPGVIQKVYWDIYVDLVPGHHRGYLCEPMTEM